MVNLSGVTLGKDACALMGFVPDVPKNLFGFKEPFFMLGSHQAVHVINNQSSQNQMVTI
ncbi:hypothetical protein [Xenorhabdus bovienii]|uniref:hypothetical protein n=1 Tax=Xenorhabdus bovienii TaxID=40576 RepID=UPI0018AF8A86|nr:hypothetical protein [Xenorhabdus bovienii]